MTQTPLVRPSDTYDIIYREYQPSDSDQAIALEQEASQHGTYGGLLQSGTLFGGEFDTKCKKFSEYIIVIAEAINKEFPNNKRICGCACLGIKNIYFNQQKVKSGVLFDLRVSDKFQRRGIAKKLTTLLEEIAKNKGWEFFYLSVNGSNKGAQALYEKMGFDFISQRSIIRELIKKVAIEDRNRKKIIQFNGKAYELAFKQLDAAEALNYYSTFYMNQDLALVDFNEIFKSQGYIGTYVVTTTDGRNTVGISLFKSDVTNIFGIKKLIFPVHYLTKDWYYSLNLSASLLVTYPLTLALNRKLTTSKLSFTTQTLLGIGGFLLGTWVVSTIYHKVTNLILHMGGFRAKGRYIGPFCFMESEGLLEEMFGFLMEKMNKVSSDNHIDSITYNTDQNDKFLAVWNRRRRLKYRTYFMGKFIQNNETSLKGYKPSEYTFFDPRDL